MKLVLAAAAALMVAAAGSAAMAETGDPAAEMPQSARLILGGGIDAGGGTEAYPEIPAPTSSTTVMLAVGDAFAIALTRAKGIERATFVRNHPGGSLGRSFEGELSDMS